MRNHLMAFICAMSISSGERRSRGGRGFALGEDGWCDRGGIAEVSCPVPNPRLVDGSVWPESAKSVPFRGTFAPAATAEIGHRSASVCHIGAISALLERKLRWDPKRERFEGDDEANRQLERPMRSPRTLG